MIICGKCKSQNPDNAQFCNSCGAKFIFDNNDKTNANNSNVGGIIVLLFIIGSIYLALFSPFKDKKVKDILGSGDNNDNNVVQEIESNIDTEIEETIENDTEFVYETEYESLTEESIGEIKDKCVELPYKKVMRNPDDYVGQYFKVRFETFSVQEKSLLHDSYIKANLYDKEYDGYYGDMIFVFDKRNPNDECYFKILDDDIIEAYCRFDGLTESKNSLTGEKSETLGLNLLYAELIEE